MFSCPAIFPFGGRFIGCKRKGNAVDITTKFRALIIGTCLKGLTVSYVHIASIHLILFLHICHLLRIVVHQVTKDLYLLINQLLLQFRYMLFEFLDYQSICFTILL
jgi:hypothetical protein